MYRWLHVQSGILTSTLLKIATEWCCTVCSGLLQGRGSETVGNGRHVSSVVWTVPISHGKCTFQSWYSSCCSQPNDVLINGMRKQFRRPLLNDVQQLSIVFADSRLCHLGWFFCTASAAKYTHGQWPQSLMWLSVHPEKGRDTNDDTHEQRSTVFMSGSCYRNIWVNKKHEANNQNWHAEEKKIDVPHFANLKNKNRCGKKRLLFAQKRAVRKVVLQLPK